MNNPETRPLDNKQIQINAGHILTELKGLQEDLKQEDIIKNIQKSATELQSQVVETAWKDFPLRTEQGAKQFLSLVKNLSFKELYGRMDISKDDSRDGVSPNEYWLNVAVTMAVQTLLLKLDGKNHKYFAEWSDLNDADGILGNKTKNAIKKFQREHGLVPDGTPGKKTIAKLLEQIQWNVENVQLNNPQTNKSESISADFKDWILYLNNREINIRNDWNGLTYQQQQSLKAALPKEETFMLSLIEQNEKSFLDENKTILEKITFDEFQGQDKYKYLKLASDILKGWDLTLTSGYSYEREALWPNDIKLITEIIQALQSKTKTE